MKHRFGTQEKSPVSKSLVISIISFLAAVFIFWEATGFVTNRTDQEEVRILERAVNRGIVHCYTIEGAYPENLQHLKDNYGLTYDEERNGRTLDETEKRLYAAGMRKTVFHGEESAKEKFKEKTWCFISFMSGDLPRDFRKIRRTGGRFGD